MTYWNLVVVSPTKEDYHNHIILLEKQFSGYPNAFHYVRSSWLDTYKDRFVVAWTDQVMHLGTTTMNRYGCLLFFVFYSIYNCPSLIGTLTSCYLYCLRD